MTGVTIKGDKKLLARLQKLAGSKFRKSIGKGTRAGAKVILPTVKRNAPSDSGKLRKALTVRAMKKSRTFVGHKVTVNAKKIKSDGKGGFYPASVEFGFKHAKGGAKIRAQRYARSARDTKQGAAVKKFESTVKEEVDTLMKS